MLTPRAIPNRGRLTLTRVVIAIMVYGIVLTAGIGFVVNQSTPFYRVASTSTPDANERLEEASQMLHAGSGFEHACGAVPIHGDTLRAELVDLGGGSYMARLTWIAAIDERSGALDVARYALYRQSLPITTDWGDPYVSLPAGLSVYTYDDADITLGETYQYAIAARDCTPLQSPPETSGLVAVPAS